MVVSVMEPKLLMKMLQVTLTGGPGGSRPSSHITVTLVSEIPLMMFSEGSALAK